MRIERFLRSIKQYAEKLEEFEKKIKGCEERAQRIIKELDEALNDRMKMVQFTKKRVEELGREIFGLGITLTASNVEVGTILDLLERVKQLEEELEKLKKEVELVDRRLLSMSTELGGLAEFKRKIERLVETK